MTYNPYMNPGYTSNNIPSGTADIAGVTWVSSIQEVQSAIVPYGKQMFMDRNSDVFYIKDHTGAMKAFKFEETPLPSNDPSNFVTKQEFDELRKKYEQLVQQYPTTAATAVESYAVNATDAQLSGNTGAGQGAILQQDSFDGNNGITAEQLA